MENNDNLENPYNLNRPLSVIIAVPRIQELAEDLPFIMDIFKLVKRSPCKAHCQCDKCTHYMNIRSITKQVDICECSICATQTSRSWFCSKCKDHSDKVICKTCLGSIIDTNSQCPFCREPISKDISKDLGKYNMDNCRTIYLNGSPIDKPLKIEIERNTSLYDIMKTFAFIHDIKTSNVKLRNREWTGTFLCHDNDLESYGVHDDIVELVVFPEIVVNTSRKVQCVCGHCE